MPQNYDYDDEDDDDYSAPTDDGLRSHARKLEKQNKAILAKLAEYEAKERKTTIETVVKAQGLNPLIADLVPADVQGADGITAWLDKFGGLFGKSEPAPDVAPAAPPASGAGLNQPGPAPVPSQVDPAVLAALAAQASSESQSPSSDVNAVEAALANTTSQDDVRKLITQYSNMRG